MFPSVEMSGDMSVVQAAATVAAASRMTFSFVFDL